MWATLELPTGEPGLAVVVVPPFGAEKVKAHRTLVALSRFLAERGAAVLRLDHRGTGDSCGPFQAFGLEDRVEDVIEAVRMLMDATGLGSWCGVGLRLGATLLAKAAAEADAGRLCLWAPVDDPEAYLRGELKHNLMEQSMRHGKVLRDTDALLESLARGEDVYVQGFPFTQRLMAEARGMALDAALSRLGPGSVTVIEPVGGRARGPEAVASRWGQAVDRVLRVGVKTQFWRDFRYHRPSEPDLFDETWRALAGGRSEGSGHGAGGAGAAQGLEPSATCEPPFLLARGKVTVGLVRETPVELPGPEGALRGILSMPVDAKVRGALLLMNSGLLPRYCYHRHYVRGARYLSGHGYAVLRLDAAGLGDSEGELPEGKVAGLWREIQSGCLVPSTLAGLDYLRDRFGAVGPPVVGGACGGAITALLAAAEATERVSGVLAISLPVCMSEDAATRLGKAGASHPKEAEILFEGYLRKLGSLQAWRRLLTGRSRLGYILAQGRAAMRYRLSRLVQRVTARAPDDGRANPRVLPAFHTLVKAGVPTLAVVAGKDPDGADFERYLQVPHLSRSRKLRRWIRVERFDLADHNFAHPLDEAGLWDLGLRWLDFLWEGVRA